MELNNRKSVMADLKKFSPIFNDNDFIEVTEWTNGEGWDITINERHFHLHMDELSAINYLTAYLEYNNE